ncbi:Acetyl-CoA acetyltransferase A, mitochondrial [Toxocara canis]|uniref:Acetyl-CoA acetyltransferase A, mitochondrial n=1 Tax=Toxocara canis TaxID=6265 RepID=A0A0B2USF6_TOXCA|nr:Acetyl-CoA acetyltransferase A, mitochondrial [Toxocara canis]
MAATSRLVCNNLSKRAFTLSSRSASQFTDVVFVGAARTPVGSFRSSLATVPATTLGSAAIKGAIEHAKIKPSQVQEVFFGCVVPSDVGQGPARQAALGAGCDPTTIVTTLNKLCASGMKSIACGASILQLGLQEIVVGGGMESMSRAPFYIPRGDTPYGGLTVVDGLLRDGLMDAYSNKLMGYCADMVAKKFGITREEQDKFAIESYKKSAAAWEAGAWQPEIVPIEVTKGKKTFTVDRDEEYTRVNFEKLPKLKPAFIKGARIVVHLIHALKPGQKGCAAICNGGGGAGGMIIEKL